MLNCIISAGSPSTNSQLHLIRLLLSCWLEISCLHLHGCNGFIYSHISQIKESINPKKQWIIERIYIFLICEHLRNKCCQQTRSPPVVVWGLRLMTNVCEYADVSVALQLLLLQIISSGLQLELDVSTGIIQLPGLKRSSSVEEVRLHWLNSDPADMRHVLIIL